MATVAPLSVLASQTHGFPWVTPVLPYLNSFFDSASANRKALLSQSPGETYRRDLQHGAFGLEQTYKTQSPVGPKFETHRKYIDIQLMVEGSEFMEIGAIADFELSEAYMPERDVMFYHPRSPVSAVLMKPSTVAIYFPEDVHRGGIWVGSENLVRKVVIKIPVPS